MKTYKEEITLNTNSRGCDIIDTVKGCPAGSLYDGKGCYGDCYAKNIADRYGFDFLKVKLRRFTSNDEQLMLFAFKDQDHIGQIVRAIKASPMPFVRIGEMGDPSVAWEHTIGVCRELAVAGKPIVIITKHWKAIPEILLKELKGLKICVNTSISALDEEGEIEYRLGEFERLKPFCNSVLRIVSCEFNTEHTEGLDRHLVQKEIFKAGGDAVIDTVFRPSHTNPWVTKNIIKVRRVKFLRAEVLASVRNPDTYFGMCQTCPDMCGVTLKKEHP